MYNLAYRVKTLAKNIFVPTNIQEYVFLWVNLFVN